MARMSFASYYPHGKNFLKDIALSCVCDFVLFYYAPEESILIRAVSVISFYATEGSILVSAASVVSFLCAGKEFFGSILFSVASVILFYLFIFLLFMGWGGECGHDNS